MHLLVARPGVERPTEWTPVNGCLVPMAGLAGQELVTAEGLGVAGGAAPRAVRAGPWGGSQCGYCTPGFACSMAAEYYRPGRGVDGDEGFDIHALSGNLCRCTGYRPIKDAALALGLPAAGDPLAARCDRPAPAAVATRTSDFVRPATLAEALQLRAEGPRWWPARPTGASRSTCAVPASPLSVAVDHLPELRELTTDDDHVSIGQRSA